MQPPPQCSPPFPGAPLFHFFTAVTLPWNVMLPVPGGGHTGIGTTFVSVALCPASTWMGPNRCPSPPASMSSHSAEQLTAVQVSSTGCPVHCRSGLHLRSNVTFFL